MSTIVIFMLIGEMYIYTMWLIVRPTCVVHSILKKGENVLPIRMIF